MWELRYVCQFNEHTLYNSFDFPMLMFGMETQKANFGLIKFIDERMTFDNQPLSPPHLSEYSIITDTGKSYSTASYCRY